MSKDYFDFDITQDIIEQPKNNSRRQYPKAVDDSTLDNKLCDETKSQQNKDIQLNVFLDMLNVPSSCDMKSSGEHRKNTPKRDCRQTLYLNEDIESCDNGNQNVINEDAVQENKISAQSDATDRRTLYLNDMEIENSAKKSKKNQLVKKEENGKRKTIYPNSSIDELIEHVCDSPQIEKHSKNNQLEKEGKDKLESIYTCTNIEQLGNNICVTPHGDSVKDHEMEVFEQELKLDNDEKNFTHLKDDKSSKGLQNVAESTLERIASYASMSSKLKSILKKQVDALATPVKTGTFNNLLYLTPRLALSDFKMSEGRIQRKELNFSSVSDKAIKRLPANLTPLHSISKRRQTLIFNDCLMDASIKNGTVENINEKNENENNALLLLNECEVNYHLMETSAVCSNDPYLQIPIRHRQSRIPVAVSNENISNKCASHSNGRNSCVHEVDEERGAENKSFDESIQLLRRAATLSQKKYLPIEHREDNEKKSLFGDNPITISDVSVFFETQRKSRMFAPETYASSDIVHIDMNGINAIEREKDDLKNSYLHLTLEDIDKTRLSLVQASYEYECDNQSVIKYKDEKVLTQTKIPNSEISNQNEENSKTFESDHNSKNYFQKKPSVCRKCKRCQETLLSETTSSASNSYVLPGLPTLPDLGLDTLNRLRKRPTISDVNVLWQNIGLNRTAVNVINLTDSYNMQNNTDDEYTTGTTCIRKYKKNMQDFENNLMEKRLLKSSSKQLTFVTRLDNLLSYSSNWVFDFQKYHRGIFTFNHKKMLNFSLLLTFDEVDPLGHNIQFKGFKLERGHIPEQYWKPIDFVLDFQFKLNLPFDLKFLFATANETLIFTNLQIIDCICMDTIKMGILLEKISFKNQAFIVRDGSKTYLRKIIRKVVKENDDGLKQHVEKIVINVELLNLNKLSFKDICNPPLYNFCEHIHLLPVGLQFLEEFLPNPLLYLKT